MPVQDSPNAIPHMNHVKVEQISDWILTKPQITYQLSCMQRIELIHCLQFKNHTVIHYQIKPIARIHFQPVIFDGQIDLTCHTQSGFG